MNIAESTRPQTDDVEEAVRDIVWRLWLHRQELTVLAITGLAYAALFHVTGDPRAAGMVLVLLAAGLLGAPPTRRALLARLRRGRVRRRWAQACITAGAGERFHTPRARGVEIVPAGELLDVRVQRGSSVPALEQRRPELTAATRAMDVRVRQDPANGARAHVLVQRADPFAGGRPLAWPNVDAETINLWDPVPVGADEHGRPVTVTLPEHSLFLAGEPGAGKTSALQMLVAAAALDPNVTLTILDGKEVDLVDWRPRCYRFAGANVKAATAALKDANAWMTTANATLPEQGRKKVKRGDPLHVVVVDELGYYAGAGNTVTDALRDLVQRGRSAGVIVLAATQKPDSKLVPTTLRDLFGYRLTLRCNTPEASDMSLGKGWAAKGYDATSIPSSQRGGAFLLAEGGTPVRLRAYRIEDEYVPRIAARTAGIPAALTASSRSAPAAPSAPAAEASAPAEAEAGRSPVGSGETPRRPRRGRRGESAPSPLPAPAPAPRPRPAAAPVALAEPAVTREVTAHLDRLPPSFNTTSGAGWRVVQREKQELQAELEEALRAAGLPCPVPGARVDVSAVLVVPDRRRRDEDNFRTPLSKALGDALQAGGWLPDDTPEHYRFGELTFEVASGSPGESRLRVAWQEPDGAGELTREQRRALIECAIRRDPERSDRAIAREFGCDHKTVSAARRRLGV